MSVTPQPPSTKPHTNPVEGSQRPPHPGDVQIGPADPDQILTVSLRLRRRPDRQAAPDPLTQRRGGHLSRAAYAAEQGAAETDLEHVARFASAHGLAVIERHAGRRTVRVAGTVRQMEQAFGVTLAHYRHSAILHRGFEGQVHLPSALADIVEHVAGLDDRPVGRPLLRQGRRQTAGQVGPQDETTRLMTPAQVAALYDFPSISAAGQTIGIIEFGGGFRLDDVATYFTSVAGLPVPDITFVSIDGAANRAPAPLAAAGSPLHGYFGTDTSQHVNYVANDGHVHELYANPGSQWYENDLTADTGGVAPAPGTVLTGYWGLDNSQHVNFIGNDGHVHELYLATGGPWDDNDLTLNANASLPRGDSPLDGYWQQDNSQHVNFISADGHVHELYIAPGRSAWEDNDITAASGCPVTATSGSALEAFYGTDTSQHIHFIGTDGHVWELYANPGEGWRSNDLTSASGGPLPVSGSPLAGYWQADSGQHVDFIDANGHVQELYLATGAAWVCNDITAAAGAAVAATPGSALSGYFGLDTSQHLQYIGTDGHVHELYANAGAGWASNDLTAASNGILPVAGSPLDGYWQEDNSQHVNFIGIDGHVHELYLDPGAAWVCNDINFNNPQAENALDIAIAGSVAQGARLVVYMAPNTEQGWVDAISTAIHDSTNNPSVLSISWGGEEGGMSDVISGVSPFLAEAASLGVTVFSSSGDAGSENPPQVLYPASDPSVTSCGGTTIANVNGAFFDQIGWGGSGGGFSTVFDRPDWQANALGSSARGVPDVGGNADPNSGYELIIGQSPSYYYGGTSAVPPLYAGLVTLLNASLGAPVGWLNATLYGLADPSVFDDITTGNNGSWNAQAGWDALTGLGSVNGAPLAYAMAGAIGPSGPIALRAQLVSTQLDAVVVDATGALSVAWVDGNNAWSGPVQIQGPGYAPAGAHVALGYPASDQQLDAVVVDSAGTLAASWVDGDGNWNGPRALSGPNYAPPGAAVALASQLSIAQLDAVVVDNTGTLSVFWVGGDGNWNGPHALSAPGYAPPGAALAMGHQVNASQLDVVLVDNTGTLSVFWVDGDGNWDGPLPISAPGHAPPGAPVALQYQASLQQLDVALVDNTGTLSVFWVDGGGGWAGPAAISAVGYAPPGASIAMEHQISWNQLDAVLVDNTGTLSVFYVLGDGAWAGPIPISGPGFAAPGAGVALAHQNSRHQLDALVSNTTGFVQVFSVVDAGAWTGPVGANLALAALG